MIQVWQQQYCSKQLFDAPYFELQVVISLNGIAKRNFTSSLASNFTQAIVGWARTYQGLSLTVGSISIVAVIDTPASGSGRRLDPHSVAGRMLSSAAGINVSTIIVLPTAPQNVSAADGIAIFSNGAGSLAANITSQLVAAGASANTTSVLVSTAVAYTPGTSPFVPTTAAAILFSSDAGAQLGLAVGLIGLACFIIVRVQRLYHSIL
jgi:hypothetical protein